MRGLTEEGKKHLADIRWVVKTMKPFQPFNLNSDLKEIDDMNLDYGEDKSDELIDYVYTKMYDVFLLMLDIIDIGKNRVFSGEYILKLLKVYNRILDDYGFILDNPQEASYHIMKYDESRITTSSSELKKFVEKNLKVLRKDSNKAFQITWDESMDNLVLKTKDPYQESEDEKDTENRDSYEDGVVLIDEEEHEEGEKLSAPYGDHHLPSPEYLGDLIGRVIAGDYDYDGETSNLSPLDEDIIDDFEEDDEFEAMSEKMDEVEEQPNTFPNFMDMVATEIEGYFSEDKEEEDLSSYFDPEDRFYEKKVELFRYFEKKGVKNNDKLIEFIDDTLNPSYDPIKYFNNMVTGYYGEEVFEKTDMNEIHKILNPITNLDEKGKSLNRLRQIRDLEVLINEKSKLLKYHPADMDNITLEDRREIKKQDSVIRELIRIVNIERNILNEEIESGMVPTEFKSDFSELKSDLDKRISDLEMLLKLSEMLSWLDS